MKAFVGLGSNLGEREAMIRTALEEMSRLPGTTLERASSLYDTEPVGDTDQPNFLNAVAQLETELPARQLLWNLLLIERRLGRVRTRRWGPRSIDLDLLLYDDLVLKMDEIELPDPDISERPFLAIPLHELSPDLTLPGQSLPIAAVAGRLSAAGMQPLPDFTELLRKENLSECLR